MQIYIYCLSRQRIFILTNGCDKYELHKFMCEMLITWRCCWKCVGVSVERNTLGGKGNFHVAWATGPCEGML